jgi:hypothetical protein
LSVAVQPDGKIVLGGDFTIPHNRIARLKPDGKIDPDFNPGTGANALVYCVAVQADGRIVLGGYFTTVNDTLREYIARLDKNGSLESPVPFSAGGHVWSVAMQTDGKISVKQNARKVAAEIRSELDREHLDKEKQISIVTGYYDLDTGKIVFYE